MISKDAVVDYLTDSEYYLYTDYENSDEYVHCYDGITSVDYRYQVLIEDENAVALIITNDNLKKNIYHDLNK